MILSIPFFCLTTFSTSATIESPADYADPARFEEQIREFEQADRTSPPPFGAILLPGSSSIRRWHPTIRQDLAPLTIIPRGFGGSNMHDALHYLDRIALKYHPRAMVLYEGDNDIGAGLLPDDVIREFRRLFDRFRVAQPNSRLYVLSVKPSPARWNLWHHM